MNSIQIEAGSLLADGGCGYAWQPSLFRICKQDLKTRNDEVSVVTDFDCLGCEYC